MEEEDCTQILEERQTEESRQLLAVLVLNKAKDNDDFRRSTFVTYCCERENPPIMIRKLLQLYPLGELFDPEHNICIYTSEIATMELFRLLLALDDPVKALTSIDYNYATESCHLAKAVSRGYVQVLQLVAEQAPEAFSVRHDRYGTVLRQALSEVDDCKLPDGGFLSSPIAMKFIIEQHSEAEQAELSCLLRQHRQSWS